MPKVKDLMIEAVAFGLATPHCLWGSADTLSRVPSRQIGYYLTSGYVRLIGFLSMGTCIVATQAFNPQLISSNPVALIFNLAAGVAVFNGILFIYRGFATGLMSIVSSYF